MADESIFEGGGVKGGGSGGILAPVRDTGMQQKTKRGYFGLKNPFLRGGGGKGGLRGYLSSR